jgi:hypothetical protein
MTVSGVGTGLAPATVLSLLKANSTSSASGATAPGSDLSALNALLVPSTGSVDSALISSPGQLYSQLQQLQSQNPDQFQQVTSTIAGQLASAAAQAPGGAGSFLETLASQFQSAAQTGDASVLQPPLPGSGVPLTGAYTAQGLVNQTLLSTLAPTTGSGGFDLMGLLGGGSSAPSGVDLAQLFANISQVVSQSVDGLSSTGSATGPS